MYIYMALCILRLIPHYTKSVYMYLYMHVYACKKLSRIPWPVLVTCTYTQQDNCIKFIKMSHIHCSA